MKASWVIVTLVVVVSSWAITSRLVEERLTRGGEIFETDPVVKEVVRVKPNELVHQTMKMPVKGLKTLQIPYQVSQVADGEMLDIRLVAIGAKLVVDYGLEKNKLTNFRMAQLELPTDWWRLAKDQWVEISITSSVSQGVELYMTENEWVSSGRVGCELRINGEQQEKTLVMQPEFGDVLKKQKLVTRWGEGRRWIKDRPEEVGEWVLRLVVAGGLIMSMGGYMGEVRVNNKVLAIWVMTMLIVWGYWWKGAR